MEYIEYPVIEGHSSRNVVFSPLKWLSKTKFESLILNCKMNKNSLNINPCLRHSEIIDHRIFIGKTIPKNNKNKFNTNEINQNNSNVYNYLEIIGSVYKANDRNWKLKITYQGSSFEIEDDFFVLQIEDPNSYYWSFKSDIKNSNFNTFSFKNQLIPKFALKAAVDKIECKYTYIGKTLKEENLSEKRPKFYSNAWLIIDETLEQIFGRISKSYKLLFAPFKDLEIGYDEFEILCLKPSPASLKVLCRTAIRSYLNFSQLKIKSIKNSFLLPECLIDFLKYPSYLEMGEKLLRDEKLVEENDKYELLIDKESGNLICRDLKFEHNKTCGNSSIIAYEVDTILLHKFYTVFYNNSKSRAITNDLILEKTKSYKLCVEWNKPSVKIEVIC